MDKWAAACPSSWFISFPPSSILYVRTYLPTYLPVYVFSCGGVGRIWLETNAIQFHFFSWRPKTLFCKYILQTTNFYDEKGHSIHLVWSVETPEFLRSPDSRLDSPGGGRDARTHACFLVIGQVSSHTAGITNRLHGIHPFIHTSVVMCTSLGRCLRWAAQSLLWLSPELVILRQSSICEWMRECLCVCVIESVCQSSTVALLR